MRYRTRPGKADGATLAAVALAAASGLLVALMIVASAFAEASADRQDKPVICSSMPQTDIKPAFLASSLPRAALELIPRRVQMYTEPR